MSDKIRMLLVSSTCVIDTSWLCFVLVDQDPSVGGKAMDRAAAPRCFPRKCVGLMRLTISPTMGPRCRNKPKMGNGGGGGGVIV